MRALIWLFRLFLFFVLFGFALKNDEVVTLQFFFGTQWRVPLVLVILVFVLVGVLVGVTATVATLVRQRREIGVLRTRLGTRDASASVAVGAVRPPLAHGADLPESY